MRSGRSVRADDVSIRAPRAGGDAALIVPLRMTGLFQSAPPVRGAICRCREGGEGERVSIRAPRAGGDIDASRSGEVGEAFQSAPPVRGAMLLDFSD